jgi:hypothetical protein
MPHNDATEFRIRVLFATVEEQQRVRVALGELRPSVIREPVSLIVYANSRDAIEGVRAEVEERARVNNISRVTIDVDEWLNEEQRWSNEPVRPRQPSQSEAPEDPSPSRKSSIISGIIEGFFSGPGI